MQKWEYVVGLRDNQWIRMYDSRKGDWPWVMQPVLEPGKKPREGITPLQIWLNKMGEDGWELIAATASEANHGYLYLKRPKP